MRKSTLLVCGLVAGMSLGYLGHPGSVGMSASASNSDIYRQLSLFGEVFERVRDKYVDSVDDSKLIEAAINGMMNSLDPHSYFLTPENLRDMNMQTRGEFTGLGIEVMMEDGLVKVIAPIEDTPAHKAGIMAGDLITHLDGEPVMGMNLQDAVSRMRGRVDTSIILTVRRASQEPTEITVVRDVIPIRSVTWQAEEDVGYVRVTQFNPRTSESLRNAIATLKEEIGEDSLKGYILDLRNNGGGLLDQGVAVADAFLNRGEIVSTRGRETSESRRHNASPGDLANDKPMIVLINGSSASASEIVAGALRDHNRATIVGTRSFGKASVQQIIPLGASGAVKLTTARYYTPAGTSIQATGIEPDIEVQQDIPEEFRNTPIGGEALLPGHLGSENGEERPASPSYIPPDRADDKQLHYALRLLRGLEIHSRFPAGGEQTVRN